MLKKIDKIVFIFILYLFSISVYSASKEVEVLVSPVSSLSRASGYISENSTESEDELVDLEAVSVFMPVRSKPAEVGAFFRAESRNLANKRAMHKKQVLKLAPILIRNDPPMPAAITGAPKGGEGVVLPVVDLATLSPTSLKKLLDEYYELL